MGILHVPCGKLVTEQRVQLRTVGTRKSRTQINTGSALCKSDDAQEDTSMSRQRRAKPGQGKELSEVMNIRRGGGI